MRRNFILLLKENNADEKEDFNCQDFINMFRKILPNSPDQEVRKLFNILHGDKDKEGDIDENIENMHYKTISFNGMLNNPTNFNKLLHSMGCINEHEHDIPSERDNMEPSARSNTNYNEMTESEASHDDINGHQDEPEDTEIYDDEVDIIHEIETTPIADLDTCPIDMIDSIVNGINGSRSSQHNGSSLKNGAPPIGLPFSNIDSIATVVTIHDDVSDTEVNIHCILSFLFVFISHKFMIYRIQCFRTRLSTNSSISKCDSISIRMQILIEIEVQHQHQK